tara:strand:- start:2190 stop:2435 length:246 start_codon:yes stop_codon:yes gene_type:complete
LVEGVEMHVDKMNWDCTLCGEQRVHITHKTLLEIKRVVAPNFKTLTLLPNKIGALLCKECDAYALGAELNVPYPYSLKAEM